MPQRDILVHDCRTSPDMDTRNEGVSFFGYRAPLLKDKNGNTREGKPKPFTCNCERRITRGDALALILRGYAVWKWEWVKDNHPTKENEKELILLHVVYPTKAHILDQRDIERFGFREIEHEYIAAFQPRQGN
jgi:hypothetical protein